MRPPQPVSRAVRSAIDVCHCTAGRCARRAAAAVAGRPTSTALRVTGATSVPTLRDEGDAALLEERCSADQLRVEAEIDAVATPAA